MHGMIMKGETNHKHLKGVFGKGKRSSMPENVKPMLKMKAGDTRLLLVKYASRFVTVGANTEITDRVSHRDIPYDCRIDCCSVCLHHVMVILRIHWTC